MARICILFKGMKNGIYTETFVDFGIECIDEIYEVFHARYDIQTNK